MIKGADRAKRRLRTMAKRHPEVLRKCITDITIKVEGYAIKNVTTGNPLRSPGALKGAIHHTVNIKGGVGIGTVGIPSRVWYGKQHELGHTESGAKWIYPKAKKMLMFVPGQGISSGKRRSTINRFMSAKGPAKQRMIASGQIVFAKKVKIKKRPWLHPAAKKAGGYIKYRLDNFTQDLLKAAR